MRQAKTQALTASQDAAIQVRERDNVIKERDAKIAELESALGVDIGAYEATIEAQKAQIHRLLAAKDEADKKFSEEMHQLEVKFSEQKKALRQAQQQSELKTEEVQW